MLRQKRDLPPCTYCGQSGHSTERCWERRSQDWKKQNPGHPVPNFKQLDLERKKARTGSKLEQGPRVSKVTFQDEAEQVPPFIMAAGADLHGTLIDSAAQVSIAGDQSLFISFTPLSPPKLLQGAFEGNQARAKGIGTVLLHVKDPKGDVHALELHGVHYVEGAQSNLLAVSTLTEQGCSVNFAGGSSRCTITNKAGDVIACIEEQQKLWPLPVVAAPPPLAAHVYLKANPEEILHLKLGHLSPTGIKFLVDKQKIEGLPKSLGELQPCHSCLTSKFPKHKFPQLATVHPNSGSRPGEEPGTT